jgi:tetratricopeptide (TPR) repeat protein
MEHQRASIQQHHKDAKCAMREGRLRDAHQHCLSVLKLDQNHADAWFICGVIAASNGLISKAVEIQYKATSLAPQNAEYLAELGKQLVALGEMQEALRQARLALDLNPSDLPTLNTLGAVMSHAGEHEDAIRCYRRAEKILRKKSQGDAKPPPEWQADLYFNLATSLGFAGEVQAAEQAYEQAIELEPRRYQAHAALAQLRRQTPENNHIERLLSLQAGAESPLEKLHLGHALAKEYEDLGDLEQSMRSLEWAKSRQASEVGYRWQDDAALFDRIAGLFDKAFMQKAKLTASGCGNSEPIFIVGMPRTGTTLVERILASHSEVYAAGELQNFPLQVKRMTSAESPGVISLETVEQSRQLDKTELGKAYIDGTRPRTGHSSHFIDKLPINFMYLGLIHLALPNAKLVCLRRDPMDTCLSNYRQLFGAKFKYYYYSYDLLDCGRYYLQFDKLMRHWHTVMPGVVHEVQYEDLIAKPERVSRELVAFCDLPWESQCLEFHRQKGSVATPSAAQVRQPIYNSSIDRWRQYGDALRPLHDLLTAAGCYPPGEG